MSATAAARTNGHVTVYLASQLSVEQRLGLIGLAHGLLGFVLVIAGARVVKAHERD